MKILEVVQSLASGGAERLVVDLCNELSASHDVTLLLLKDVDHFYLPQVLPSVRIIEAKLPVGGGIVQLYKCYKIIKKLAPDVVHYHSYARYNLLLANVLLGRKFDFYMTIHSDVSKNYSRGKSGLQVKIAGILGKCKFITISQTNYDQFQSCHSRLFQKLIPNGRSLPSLTSELPNVKSELDAFRRDDETVLFVHVARYHSCKNQKMLVNAFNQLIKDGCNISLVVIGANFDCKEGQEIVQLANNDIHFLGLKSNVYDYLVCSDAFCLSSVYEGMPMTIIEAILSGLPIVSTPVCGVVDVVKNGINGYVSKDYDIESYVSTIKQFLDNREEISKKAKELKDKTPLSIVECAKEYSNLFLK